MSDLSEIKMALVEAHNALCDDKRKVAKTALREVETALAMLRPIDAANCSIVENSKLKEMEDQIHPCVTLESYCVIFNSPCYPMPPSDIKRIKQLLATTQIPKSMEKNK